MGGGGGGGGGTGSAKISAIIIIIIIHRCVNIDLFCIFSFFLSPPWMAYLIVLNKIIDGLID